MNIVDPRPELRPTPTPPAASAPETTDALAQQADFAVAECFFIVGQVVGMRTTLDYDAVVWGRDHYRARFLAAMTLFGDRWLEDRTNVSSVAMLLGERLVRYAEGKPSIDLETVRRAAAEVERYCKVHSKRKARAMGLATSDEAPARIAGYWCNYEYGDEMP